MRQGSRVYWTVLQAPDGRVMSAPVSGAADAGAPVVLAAGQDLPFGVALAPTMVFWVDQGLRGS